MRRLARFTVLAWWLPVVALQCWSGFSHAQAPSPTDASAAKRPPLELSSEVQRCLRVGQLARPDRENAQLQCLASQDETGFVELVRAIAKRRQQQPSFGAERIEHLSWKLRRALSEGRQGAAVAVETMLDDEPAADPELAATALEAMRWVTIARREADLPKGRRAGAQRPLVVTPRACAERIDAAEPRVAQKAVACVAEAEAGIPTQRLIDAVLRQPDRVEIWRILKRLRKLPEPEARRLAEALVARPSNDDGRANQFCQTLLNTTSLDAVWATLAGRRTFDLFGVKECEGLARRSQQPEPERQNERGPEQSPVRTHCLDVPTRGHDYVSLCADDLGPVVSDPSRRGKLQVRQSRFGRYEASQPLTTHPWLLEGERLLVDELSYVRSMEPAQKSERSGNWPDGLAILPSSKDDGSRRRLHVFALRNMRLSPLWQSPECGETGCRLDLVARSKVDDGELLGLVLLMERQARPVALGDLLQGTLDDRLGCSRLRPLTLGDCTGLGGR